jgi:bacterioferritin (cytochrome b1)
MTENQRRQSEMKEVDTTKEAQEVLSRALEVEYQMIINTPQIARMIPGEELALKVERLGLDSVRHADVVANTISKLGGVPPFPRFQPLPEFLDLKDFFKKQLDLEHFALDLHSRAARVVGEHWAPSLLQLAEDERWHIKVVEDIISRLTYGTISGGELRQY